MLLAIVLLVQSACLVPQSIDALDPDAGTRPAPRIEINKIPSDLLQLVLPFYRQGAADAAATPPCVCHLDFTGLFVQDDDPFVTLQARWFVDYDTAVPSSLAIREQKDMPGSTDFNNPTTERGVPDFAFDAVGQGITTNGIHIVEVVIADRDGFDTTNTQRPFRSVLPGFQTAEYRFAVQVNLAQDPNQPTCPNNVGASVRVCQ